MPCKTSASWAQARRNKRTPDASASRDWESNHQFPGEDADQSHRTVFGGILRFDELVAFAPTAHEQGPDWCADEDSRLGRLARRLWDPLLAQEARR